MENSIKMKYQFAALLAALAVSATLAASASATVLDLGSSGSGFAGGAYFSTTDIQPTGTGVFDPFLTVQNSPWEQGYNSNTQNFDTKRVPQWNHEIKFSDMSVSVNQWTRSGASCRQSSFPHALSTNVLSSANSMNGCDQIFLIS